MSEKSANAKFHKWPFAGKTIIIRSKYGNMLPVFRGAFDREGHLFPKFFFLIPLIAVLVIILGRVLIHSKEVILIPIVKWPLFFALMIASLFLHELLKSILVRAGVGLQEAGLLLWGYIPVGIYISSMRDEGDGILNSSRNAVMLYVTGLSGNLMAAGTLFFLTAFWNNPVYSFTTITCARFNVALAVLNALPAFGGDGQNALKYLIGFRRKNINTGRIIVYKVINMLSSVAFMVVLGWIWFSIIKLTVDSAWPAPYVLNMLDTMKNMR